MMSIKHLSLRTAAVLVAVLAAAAVVSALDLPVKTVKGKEYYYYKVEKDETVYSLSHRFGISHSDMVKYNPWVADGLRAGKTLYFPVSEFGTQYGGSTVTTEHIVKKGDTLFSLSRKYSVSPDAIVALNPGADQGIKVGQKLLIPGGTAVQDAVSQQPAPSTRPAGTETAETAEAAPVKEDEVSIPMFPTLTDELTPVNPPYRAVESDENDVAVDVPELRVAVCLPFLLGDDSMSKTAVYATDFYRGFLLGIDSLRSQYGNPPIHITAIDSDAPDQPFNALVRRAGALRQADIIIAPETMDRVEDLAKFGSAYSTYIFNTFQARDTTCNSNPYMIQGNIPANDMYDKVIDYFVDNLDGATPVILDNEKGDKDKQQFVDALGARLISKGVDYKTLKYNGTMTSSAILEKLPPEGVNYVFVPVSGALKEFHRFATALARYKTEASQAVEPGRVRLFGYPEYTRFSGDALDKLKTIGTTFYSRFYNDDTTPASDAIKASFIDRYGTSLPDGVPNQALYGFDVARWLLALAAAGQVTPQTITDTVIEDGAQMAYRFEQIPGGGFVNNTVFIITLDEVMPTKTVVL